MLRAVAARLSNVEDAELRISARLDVADLLWGHDSSQARGQIKSALEEALALRPAATGDQDRSPRRLHPLVPWILQSACRRDARFGAELAQAVFDGTAAPEERESAYLAVAAAVAASEPDLAARWIRAVMTPPFEAGF